MDSTINSDLERCIFSKYLKLDVFHQSPTLIKVGLWWKMEDTKNADRQVSFTLCGRWILKMKILGEIKKIWVRACPGGLEIPPYMISSAENISRTECSIKLIFSHNFIDIEMQVLCLFLPIWRNISTVIKKKLISGQPGHARASLRMSGSQLSTHKVIVLAHQYD